MSNSQSFPQINSDLHENLLNSLDQVCESYAYSLRDSLSSLLAIQVSHKQPIFKQKSLTSEHDLIFSILCTGQIYGEFFLTMNKKTALEVLGLLHDQNKVDLLFEDNKSDVLDTFKEICNIAVGQPFADLRLAYPDINISPPRSIEGKLTLSEYEIFLANLETPAGVIQCGLYVDKVKLDIAQTLNKSKLQLVEEKQKQEELKRLNKAKSEFLANMSHELRTPLNGMIGMLDLIKNTDLNKIQREQINIICHSGDFLLSIINDILDFSKIEAGKLVIENRPFNLRRSLEAVITSLSEVVYTKGLDFYVFIDPAISGLYLGDETRIKQSISNLIGNAIKFTPKGTISFIAEIVDGKIQMSVKDTGIGIPESKLNAIFESFSQADVSDNRKYGGSGLGLTITKSIIEAMNGQLSVASQEAVGSEFTITVPLSKDSNNSVNMIEFTKNPQHKVMIFAESKKLISSLENNLSYLCEKQNISISDEVVVNELKNYNRIFFEGHKWISLAEEMKNEITKTAEQNKIRIIIIDKVKELIKISETISANVCTTQHLPLLLDSLRDSLQVAETTLKNSADKIKSLNEDKIKKQGLILLVEDNTINQMVATAMIKKMGYTVEVADNGQIAVDKLKEKNYDVILMDCQMPIMNGYEATEAIRKFDDTTKKNTPIIALTANAFKEIKEKCFECGMNDFTTKPLKQEGLEEMLSQYLKKNE